MRILFVSMVSFKNNASATIRNKSLIKGLYELGHSVDIMTLKPSEDSINYDDSMNDINEFITNYYYININSLYSKLMARKDTRKTKKSDENNIMKSTLNKGRYIIKKIYRKISIFDAQKINVSGLPKNKDYHSYDVIVSSSDPKSSHLLVERIFKENKKCKAKWIQYWGDPMFIDITRKSDWRDGIVKSKERKLIGKADRIIYTSPLTLLKQKEIFYEYANKMDYANQAYVSVENINLNINKNINRKKIEVLTVGYFGAYKATVRNIMPLYNAAIDSNFKLNICGNSDIVLDKTSNISIYGNVSYKKSLELEMESDILTCICNIRGTQIPGKIYYSAGYKKPIIVIVDGEYKEELIAYLEQFNRYIICDNDEKSIKKAVEKAKNQLYKENYIISNRLTSAYMANKILNKDYACQNVKSV